MDKKYLYGVIKGDENKTFGVVDTSASKPTVIHTFLHKGLSVIYTPIELGEDEEILATRKNLISHQKAIERVMEEHSIIPFGFGMVVDSDDDLKEILEEKYSFFQEKLKALEGKIELNIKGVWNSMAPVYDAITQSNSEIKELKNELQRYLNPDQSAKIELGKKVEFALTLEKERLCDKVITKLNSTFEDYRLNKTITEEMFCNLAFLIDCDEEATFDDLVNQLSEELSDNITFKYVGPLPPYNFLD